MGGARLSLWLQGSLGYKSHEDATSVLASSPAPRDRFASSVALGFGRTLWKSFLADSKPSRVDTKRTESTAETHTSSTGQIKVQSVRCAPSAPWQGASGLENADVSTWRASLRMNTKHGSRRSTARRLYWQGALDVLDGTVRRGTSDVDPRCVCRKVRGYGDLRPLPTQDDLTFLGQ
jgi:hypothetical protein